MVLITIPFKDDPDSFDALYKLDCALNSLDNQTTRYFTTLVVVDGEIASNNAHYWAGKTGISDRHSFFL